MGDGHRATPPPTAARPTLSGPHNPPSAHFTPPNYLEIERYKLSCLGYPSTVTATLLADRRQFTNQVYTWKVLLDWCASRSIDAERLRVIHLLEFLQTGLEKGLSAATFWGQVSSIASILGHLQGRRLASHSHVKKLLGGCTAQPPSNPEVPILGLRPGSQGSDETPPSSLWPPECSDCSPSRQPSQWASPQPGESELVALSMSWELCWFHKDRVVIPSDLTFLPKVNSTFHLVQEVVLPSALIQSTPGNVTGIPWTFTGRLVST